MGRPSNGYKRTFGSSPAPSDMFTGGPPEHLLASDIAAIDRGEGRTIICSSRGGYGRYPRKFHGYLVDLGPEGMVVRASPLFFWHHPVPVTERVLSARERPFGGRAEAVLHNGAGVYSAGATLEHAGTVVVVCRTSSGLLEFCVRRPDLRLFCTTSTSCTGGSGAPIL